MDNTIGNMNGWWAISLKATLISFPILAGMVVTWMTWATNEIQQGKYFREYGQRFTLEMGSELESRLELQLRIVNDRIGDLREQNSSILTEIEYLKKKP